MKFSLKNKITFSIEIVLVLLVLVVGVASFFALESIFRNRTFAQLQSVTILKESAVKNLIDDVSSEMGYQATNIKINTQLVSFLEKGSLVEKQLLYEYFLELSSVKKEFSDYFVLDISGNVLLSTYKGDEGKVKTSEPYFLNAKEKTFFQDFYYDVSIGTTAIMVGTPIKNMRGELVGVLVGRVVVEELSRLIQERSGLGNTGESVMINANNLAVTDLLKEPGQAMKRTIFTPQVLRCLSGDTFSGRFTDYHGDEVYGYYKWFPEVKSCVLTKQDVSEVSTSLNQLFVYGLGLTGGVLFLAGMVIFFLAGRLFSPLQALRDEAIKINEGNYDVHVQVISNDEIGELSTVFNEMGEKLRVSYRGLQDKVEEKTKELNEKVVSLEKLNELMVGRELKMLELKKALAEKNNP